MAVTDYLIIGLINHNMDNTIYVIYYARHSKQNTSMQPLNH